MRRTLIAFLVAAALLAACGAEESNDTATPQSSAGGCDKSSLPLFEDGVLTVATDRPAYEPWFSGSPKHYSGFEGDLATEVAKRLDLPIEWVVEPFNKSYAPGDKDYDFDVNQISITPERAQVVDFSDGYFDDNQGFLAMEGNDIADATTIADLKEFQLGTQVGTTSLQFINETIQPSQQPQVFDTTNDAKSALESGQIDALVTDLVTTVYLRDFEIKGSVVTGQYPTHEQFGMLFEKGNPLVTCVNEVLGEIRSDGTLDALQDKWLHDYLDVPTIQD
jgi:polar amino acid transport system substrate-binding protein